MTKVLLLEKTVSAKMNHHPPQLLLSNRLLMWTIPSLEFHFVTEDWVRLIRRFYNGKAPRDSNHTFDHRCSFWGSFSCWSSCASAFRLLAQFSWLYQVCPKAILLCTDQFSCIVFVFKVWIGRLLMETFYGQGPHHELYTAFAGLYFCWLVLRGIHVFSNMLGSPAGWSSVLNRIKSYTILVS